MKEFITYTTLACVFVGLLLALVAEKEIAKITPEQLKTKMWQSKSGVVYRLIEVKEDGR